MAGTRADNLKQFTVTSVEELDEAKEMGRGCYGAVFRVRLHGLPCIAKRLHDILVGRGREERVSREQRRAVIDRFREELCSTDTISSVLPSVVRLELKVCVGGQLCRRSAHRITEEGEVGIVAHLPESLRELV